MKMNNKVNWGAILVILMTALALGSSITLGEIGLGQRDIDLALNGIQGYLNNTLAVNFNLSGPMNAAGFPIKNAVLINATLDSSDLQTNKMVSIFLFPLSATGYDVLTPGTSLVEPDSTFRSQVDFATVNYTQVRFVLDATGSESGAGKCLAIVGNIVGTLVYQCWDSSSRVNKLASNWTAFSDPSERTILFKVNGSSGSESITIRGVEVQFR